MDGVRSGRAIYVIGPLGAVATVLALGYKPVWTLWHSGVPWVLNIYQDGAVSAGDVTLLALALIGLLTMWRLPAAGWPAGTRLALGAGGILVVCLGASVFGALAPLLSVACCIEFLAGLAAYLTIVRRPWLARGILLGGAVLLVIELPLAIAQIATQSTFPTVRLLDGLPREETAAMPGAAVLIVAGGARWQRALGSFPHPNILGGFAAVAVVCALPYLTSRHRRVVLALWVIAWTEVLLSFSRAALLAALIGCGCWVLGQVRARPAFRQVVRTAGLPCAAVVLGLLLTGAALPGRYLPTSDTLTSPAVTDRLLLDSIAMRLIRAHPLTGVGAGNFTIAELLPPFAAISVDPVHVVPLLVAAEAGVVAGLAWLAILLAQPLALWRSARWRGIPWTNLALPATLLTLALCDHFLWTFAPGRALFWLSLRAWSSLQAGRPASVMPCPTATTRANNE
ncbi:MAG: O-antigen ligase family protein [Thermomicrobiales bacterium]